MGDGMPCDAMRCVVHITYGPMAHMLGILCKQGKSFHIKTRVSRNKKSQQTSRKQVQPAITPPSVHQMYLLLILPYSK
jgi:hypothetical protein